MSPSKPLKPVSSPTKRTRPSARHAILPGLLKTIGLRRVCVATAPTAAPRTVSPSTSTTPTDGHEKTRLRDDKPLLIKVAQAKALAARIRATPEASVLPYSTQARRLVLKKGGKVMSRFKVKKHGVPSSSIPEPSMLPSTPSPMIESEEGVEVTLPPPMPSEDVRITSPMDVVFPSSLQPTIPPFLPEPPAVLSVDQPMAALDTPQDPILSIRHPSTPPLPFTSPPSPFLSVPTCLPIFDVPMSTPSGPESPSSPIEVDAPEANDTKMRSPSPPATQVDDPATALPVQEDTRMASVSPPATKTTFGSIDVVMSELASGSNAPPTPLPIAEDMASPPAVDPSNEASEALLCGQEPEVVNMEAPAKKYPTYSNPFFGLDEEGIYEGFAGPHLDMHGNESGWGTKRAVYNVPQTAPTSETPTSTTPTVMAKVQGPSISSRSASGPSDTPPTPTAPQLSPSIKSSSHSLKRRHCEVEGTRTASPLSRSGSDSSSLFDSLDKIVSDDDSEYTSLEELEVDARPPPPKRVKMRYSDGFQLYNHYVWPRSVEQNATTNPPTEGGSGDKEDASATQATTPSPAAPQIQPGELDATPRFEFGKFRGPLPERFESTVLPLSLIRGDQDGYIRLRALPPTRAMMKPRKSILKRAVVPVAEDQPQTPITSPEAQAQAQPPHASHKGKVRLDARCVEFKSRPTLQGGIARLGKPGVLVRIAPRMNPAQAWQAFMKRVVNSLHERAPGVYGPLPSESRDLDKCNSDSDPGPSRTRTRKKSRSPVVEDEDELDVLMSLDVRNMGPGRASGSERPASTPPVVPPSSVPCVDGASGLVPGSLPLTRSQTPPCLSISPPADSSSSASANVTVTKAQVPLVQQPEVEEGEIVAQEAQPTPPTRVPRRASPSPSSHSTTSAPSSSSSSSASSPSCSGSEDEYDANSASRFRGMGSLAAGSAGQAGPIPSSRPARWNVWTRDGYVSRDGRTHRPGGYTGGNGNGYSSFPKPWRRWGS